MTTQELNIANALSTAKEVLVQMLAQGFGETKYVFALSNMLVEKFKQYKNHLVICQETSVVKHCISLADV